MGFGRNIRHLSWVAVAFVFTGITVVWHPFHSTLYPYSLSLPSSFVHMSAPPAPGNPATDFFFGVQGTSLTNVNIEATRGNHVVSPPVYLRDADGNHVRREGTIRIMGHSERLWAADFSGPGGRFSVETTTFAAGGFVWRLTMQCEPRVRYIRPTLMRILRSFKLDSRRH